MQNPILKWMAILWVCSLGMGELPAQISPAQKSKASPQLTLTVLDGTGRALPGASIVVFGTTIGNVTDVNGKATLGGISPGDHEINVSYVGYQGVNCPVSIQLSQQYEGKVILANDFLNKKNKRKSTCEITEIGAPKTSSQGQAAIVSSREQSNFQLGSQALLDGKYQEAESYFTMAIAGNYSPLESAYLGRAQARYKRGLNREASDDLVPVFNRRGNLPEALRLRGLISYEQEYFEDALKDFDAYLKQKPQDEEIEQKRRVAQKEVDILNPNPESGPPIIQWTEKPSGSSEKKDIQLSAQVASQSELHLIQLYHNDRKVSDLGQRMVTGGIELWAYVSLEEGDNSFYIEAVNSQGKASSGYLHVNYGPLLQETTRRNFALLIAIEAYQHKESWKKLNNPVYDAQALSSVLTERYGFETELLTNPSREQLQRKIREYVGRDYQAQDQLLVFYSGHGNKDELLGRGQFVAADSKDELNSINHIDFLDQVDRIPCPHILLLADACFSGMMEDLNLGEKDKREPSRGSRFYQDKSDEDFLNNELKKRSRKFIASGSEEVPDGAPNRHSPFMYKVLEALEEGRGGDHFLEFAELSLWLSRLKASHPVDGNFGSNQPGSNFIFVGE